VKLQAKLTSVLALAALLPIVGAAALVRWNIRRTYEDAAARALEAARRDGERQFRALARSVEEAAQAMADPRDHEIGPLLLDLAKGTFDEEKRHELERRAPQLLHERSLDVLELIDAHGRVLACGHDKARAGDPDPQAVARAHRYGGQPLLVEERIYQAGQLQPALALEAVRVARGPAAGSQVVVVVGRVLGERFIDALHQHGRLEARLVTGDGGAQIAGPPEGWEHARRYPRSELALAGADRVVKARLELAVADDDLRSVLNGTTRAATLVAAGAVALVLVLGALVAHRISRPVQELSRGAAAIAQGQLDVKLEVKRRNDELWDLVRAFEQMASELQRSKEQLVQAERVAAWREIARRIAHEIKNPLTPIQMSIETMRRTRGRRDFDEIFEEGTRTILAEVTRLKRIVQEFSDFARMPKPTLEPCNLAEVAKNALALYGGGAAPVRSELPADTMPRVMADKHQMQQVILNLLENARDAVQRKGKGEIVVRARSSATSVQIEIEDTGVGFSESVRERMFVPYFTTKESGTGLGLAIVHRIVNDHGGRISVNGREGSGATFTISIPLPHAILARSGSRSGSSSGG
jgi:signal transduction histidine kinase